MVEELKPNIYRIKVPLPNNPLKELNSYYIKGDSRSLLIDTGFRQEECRTALEAGLSAIQADMDVTDLLITHLHTDHSGLAQEIAGANSKIYVSQEDIHVLSGNLTGENFEKQNERYLDEGFPEELLYSIQKVNPARVLGIKNWIKGFLH